MEAGPAVLFSADELMIPPEPALPEGFDKLDLSGLDGVDLELATHHDVIQAAFDELQPEAMGWQDVIQAASDTIELGLVTAPAQISQDILDNRDGAQAAIDGAESSFISDAYTETPPWFQPATDQIPETPDQAVDTFV